MTEKRGKDWTWRFQDVGDKFIFETMHVYADKRIVPLSSRGGETQHKGLHKKRPSQQFSGFCRIDTVRRLTGGKPIAALAEERREAQGETSSVLSKAAGVIEAPLFLVLEIETDNPAKMHNTIAGLAKVRKAEQDVGVWRGIVEVPGNSAPEFFQRVTAIRSAQIRARVIEQAEARGVLGDDGGPLAG